MRMFIADGWTTRWSCVDLSCPQKLLSNPLLFRLSSSVQY